MMLKDYVFPGDLKNMTVRELELLSYEIRDFLISSVSKTGGHLASNLGIVELTIALHKVFDSPRDKIIWDVGHQAYVHKILTGRASGFENLRQSGGLSGFPKASESEHDAFDTGHASNSISAGLGYAVARDAKGEEYDVISVIGDGALTGGMAYEALNNVGGCGSRQIVILNDNGMSISPNRGSMSAHLSRLRTSDRYLNAKKRIKRTLKKIPAVGEKVYDTVGDIKKSLKYTLVGGAIFEELGLSYMGPCDGHNIEELLEILRVAKESDRPALVHVITKKGKGYINAEKKPSAFHGIGAFDSCTGIPINSGTVSYSDIFGKKLLELARRDERVLAISAAMEDGTGLSEFARAFPERIHDVGIAEEHAVTFAAGLAKGGMKPFVAIYSTFLQRAYDQIMIDVAMQNLPVVFAVDRAGVVGEDGETHNGVFDLSYLSHIPNLTVLAPKNGAELCDMMEFALNCDNPCAIRYPRGRADTFADISESVMTSSEADIAGENTNAADYVLYPEIIKTGSDIEIWAIGKMVSVCSDVVDILQSRGIDAGLINARNLHVPDSEFENSVCRAKMIVTAEDNVLIGGFGSLLNTAFTKLNCEGKTIYNIAWRSEFIPHGKTDLIFENYGLDAKSVAAEIERVFREKKA